VDRAMAHLGISGSAEE